MHPVQIEVKRAMAQLDFWLELGELSQLGSAQLTNFDLLTSSAQLTNLRLEFSWAQLSSRNFNGQLSSFYELENEPSWIAHLAHL